MPNNKPTFFPVHYEKNGMIGYQVGVDQSLDYLPRQSLNVSYDMLTSVYSVVIVIRDRLCYDMNVWDKYCMILLSSIQVYR